MANTGQAGSNYLLPGSYGQGCVPPLCQHLQDRVPVCQHLQGRVPLMPHTCRAVSPPPILMSHSHRAVFSLVPHTCGAVLPLSHTLTGPCSPYAAHLQGRVSIMPHNCGAVFPLCCTLAGLCSPYATHLRGRVSPMPHTCGAVFPLCHSLVRLCSYATHTGPSCQVARTK